MIFEILWNFVWLAVKVVTGASPRESRVATIANERTNASSKGEKTRLRLNFKRQIDLFHNKNMHIRLTKKVYGRENS